MPLLMKRLQGKVMLHTTPQISAAHAASRDYGLAALTNEVDGEELMLCRII
jgi:hypothetical protein